mmetsp:Transcript_34049/g.109580  ORF Transcript_34049/g.109580 Transcript_34049/m.109580 type:complete len:268 (-) Transcript_34049:385-1188(-)
MATVKQALHAGDDLLLLDDARTDVDDGEEAVGEEKRDRPPEVEGRVLVRELAELAQQAPGLPREGRLIRLRQRGEGVRGRRPGRRPKRVEDEADRLGAAEVLVDQLEHVLRRAVAWRHGLAQRVAVLAERRCRAVVRWAAGGQDERVVEAREDLVGGLVDGAEDGGALDRGGLLEESHDGGGGGSVQPRGRLVEEDERRVLRERDSQREAPLLTARKPAHELVAGARVLARCEAHVLEQLVDRGGPLGRTELVLVERGGDGKVLARR